MPGPPSYEQMAAVLAPGTAPGGDDQAVLAQLAGQVAASDEPDRAALKVAVRALAQLLAQAAPGRTVEVRVPPYAAVQCVAGPRHTRGTPPNVVEADPLAFVRLCTGALAWDDAVADGRLRASGERAALVAERLPLVPPAQDRA